MSIFQEDMLTGLNKVETAIALLQAVEPPVGYYGAFSGGKDSCVIKHLTAAAGVKADWHYCVSPIDPKEVQDFIKQTHPDVQWDYYARGFRKMIELNGMPLRQGRWCCRFIKEAGGLGRTVITGIRHAESAKRKSRKCFEKGRVGNKIFVHPIITWSDGEVWEYIGVHNLKVCSLYAEGFHRIGCVLCPFHRNVKYELERFPKIAKLWRLGCEDVHKRRLTQGKVDTFRTSDDRWHFWLDRDAKRRDKRQGVLGEKVND